MGAGREADTRISGGNTAVDYTTDRHASCQPLLRHHVQDMDDSFWALVCECRSQLHARARCGCSERQRRSTVAGYAICTCSTVRQDRFSEREEVSRAVLQVTGGDSPSEMGSGKGSLTGSNAPRRGLAIAG